jgi:surface antigen
MVNNSYYWDKFKFFIVKLKTVVFKVTFQILPEICGGIGRINVASNVHMEVSRTSAYDATPLWVASTWRGSKGSEIGNKFRAESFLKFF